jgi:hypothetical protein
MERCIQRNWEELWARAIGNKAAHWEDVGFLVCRNILLCNNFENRVVLVDVRSVTADLDECSIVKRNIFGRTERNELAWFP